MKLKFSFALTIALLFVQFISSGQSVTGREKKTTGNKAADLKQNDCEQNTARLYEMLDAKDQEIRRSREQANELIKVLTDLKHDQDRPGNTPQKTWATQSDEQTVKIVDHIVSERKTNYHVRRQYIRGPRGGCYYINSNGNKTYVDRSVCN